MGHLAPGKVHMGHLALSIAIGRGGGFGIDGYFRIFRLKLSIAIRKGGDRWGTLGH